MGWQPIETAPSYPRECLIAWTCEMSGLPMISIAHKNYKGRWFSLDDGELYPTHWQPLPEPPCVQEDHQ